MVAETDPLGRTTRARYDRAGRQTSQTDATGRTTTWAFDASGRVESVSVDGAVVSSIERNIRARRVIISDHTRPGSPASEHVLEWNPRGQLVRRTRDGRAVSWEYDADGRRTAMTTPDGTRTTYTWDAAGRLQAIEHPLLGRAAFERDAAGRLVTATADGLIQSWEHRDGWVVAHTLGDSDGFTRTTIDRDDEGRVLRVDRDGLATTYDYDEARQLIAARTGGSATRWRYDPAGRLVTETTDGTTTEHTYDAAGQLLTTTGPDGQTLTYTYDALGRRTRVAGDDGSSRDLEWSATGWLGSVTDRDARGTRRTALHVDALAELESVDDTEVFWDTAASYGATPVQAGDVSVLAAGPVTGVGSSWTSPGWRTARSADGAAADPWSVGAATDLPGALGIGAAGELTVGGLEWLGARVYDPASRGFLSVDPLDPVPGAGWAGNPYSYAGNDPLHALDPLGLRPVTDAELKAYAAAHQGALHAAGDWLHDNWEYVAGGAMVIAGGVLIATGVGGPAGMMLVCAGADTIIQKATTGHVNWGQVAVAGVAGGVGFGAGSLAARAGLSGLRGAMAVGVAGGAAEGGVYGGGSYLTGPGPHTVNGLLTHTAVGTAAGGALGGAGGAAAHGLTSVAGRLLGTVETPYGTAVQEVSHPALAARSQVADGAPVYRIGTLGRSQAAEAQFWALEHPTTPGYAARYGIPEENVINADFVEQGRVPARDTVHHTVRARYRGQSRRRDRGGDAGRVASTWTGSRPWDRRGWSDEQGLVRRSAGARRRAVGRGPPVVVTADRRRHRRWRRGHGDPHGAPLDVGRALGAGNGPGAAAQGARHRVEGRDRSNASLRAGWIPAWPGTVPSSTGALGPAACRNSMAPLATR